MTDLERARWLLPEGTDEVEVRVLADELAAARREGAAQALREAVKWHKAEAAKALSEAERLSDWGRWWRGDETWRDRAELHERAAAHMLGEEA